MLMSNIQYIVPYKDIVDQYYILINTKFTNTNYPTVSLIGYSELESLVIECFISVLNDVSGNSGYSKHLDDAIFPTYKQKIMHNAYMFGYSNINRLLRWYDYFVDEILYVNIQERFKPLRSAGFRTSTISWIFDKGCCVVS